MSRGKEPAIPNELLDQLLAGGAVSAALEQGALLNLLKKALIEPAEAGELFRAQPAGPSVRPRGCPSWPHQQVRAQPRPRGAGRGGLSGGKGAGAAACLLRADQGQARSPDRCCRTRPQAHRALLASSDQGDRLSVGTPGAGRHEAPRHGIALRPAAEETQQAWPGPRLQHQDAARSGNGGRSTRRAGLRAVRRAVENTPKGARTLQVGGQVGRAVMRRPGRTRVRCSALRRGVARARSS